MEVTLMSYWVSLGGRLDFPYVWWIYIPSLSFGMSVSSHKWVNSCFNFWRWHLCVKTDGGRGSFWQPKRIYISRIPHGIYYINLLSIFYSLVWWVSFMASVFLVFQFKLVHFWEGARYLQLVVAWWDCGFFPLCFCWQPCESLVSQW